MRPSTLEFGFVVLAFLLGGFSARAEETTLMVIAAAPNGSASTIQAAESIVTDTAFTEKEQRYFLYFGVGLNGTSITSGDMGRINQLGARESVSSLVELPGLYLKAPVSNLMVGMLPSARFDSWSNATGWSTLITGEIAASGVYSFGPRLAHGPFARIDVGPAMYNLQLTGNGLEHVSKNSALGFAYLGGLGWAIPTPSLSLTVLAAASQDRIESMVLTDFSLILGVLF